MASYRFRCERYPQLQITNPVGRAQFADHEYATSDAAMAEALAALPGRFGVVRVGDGAPDDGRAGSPQEAQTPSLAEATTAAQVLAWVGEDRERAAEALAAEEARDKPRSTLVRDLTKLAED